MSSADTTRALSSVVIGSVVIAFFCIWATFGGASIARSESYPDRPVRIVTVEPAGTLDIVSRLVAQNLTKSLGQAVIVENRGAAGGAVAALTVAKASPDGYSMLAHGKQLWLTPYMRDNVGWDPIKDFVPITVVDTSPSVLVVAPSFPAKSVQDLIDMARAKPGQLNYGSGGTGAANHIAAELFKAMAHVNIVNVPYRGAAPALSDIMGGRIQLMFPSGGSVMPHIKAGRLRALAVTTAQPTSLVPGVPTIAATGLPGYEDIAVHGIFAPRGTPTAIVDLLSKQIVSILNRADIKETMFAIGLEAVGSTPEGLAKVVKAEMVRLGKVIKDAGIRAE